MRACLLLELHHQVSGDHPGVSCVQGAMPAKGGGAVEKLLIEYIPHINNIFSGVLMVFTCKLM